jgi:hypothetical protein
MAGVSDGELLNCGITSAAKFIKEESSSSSE